MEFKMNNPVYFTRAKEEEKRWTETTREERQTITGQEARDFYQSLLRESHGEKTKEGEAARRGAGAKRRRRREGSGAEAVSSSERDGHRLLRCAQDGDTQGLKELLRRGCDVNFRDDFFWTAVMCASKAGQTEAVGLLLRHGAAWVGVVDRQGRDARDLALQAGHQDVVRELEQFVISDAPNIPTTNHTESAASQWCDVCAVCYTDSTETHSRSTLHQFSKLRPPATPQYCLPSSSTSYKMMLRLGWNPASGLGPAHSGRKNPVSTILKRDQAGLGYGETPQPKVTHFQPRDLQAVQHIHKEKRLRQEKRATLSAKELKRKEERDQRWERDYRTSFNYDF
ncbi:G patch domain and ankyrin repeat-containing protein 1-like isoform X1 [Carassius auratus]|uniref:G patch domain and ankyrin repeat-containing protein 1-like isoform X1 n=1 Tax=Carassius auratus TaxID=7957 RepID=A0A6P6Q391_CARAU|nr:G patch domain and ankyrin repeat-containing protein 1-like isoform X1 [Carassius auratus]XP_026127526.1 G patch domain and ankyrin repeat-containing protein 1-like isoform X1 [Carassius auratus]XP_026127534.1 G patch domain and ankyrin repeat-containing protein 1-like isoform X1 [Carassius auratus]